MILLIDASNIRAGGGVTHLVELLKVANPIKYEFTKVVVWAPKSTLNKIEDREWLEKKHLPVLERNFIMRALWQRSFLHNSVLDSGFGVLFVPGGSFATSFRPVVTMSQNLLPFMWSELMRYYGSLFFVKLLLLRSIQSKSFRQADGVIFLTNYARDTVLKVARQFNGLTRVISHGIDERFISTPRVQLDSSVYNNNKPFRLLYVSIVDAYKHQWHVASAVRILRELDLPITIDFVGPANQKYLYKLNSQLLLQGNEKYLNYVGAVPFDKLDQYYKTADAFVFASSCENMPNILIEAMAAGLPIVCSNKGPMPEVLGEAGVYFDPESPRSIADAIKLIFDSPQIRRVIAELAYQKATCYSWHRCADQTFSFLRDVALSSNVK